MALDILSIKEIAKFLENKQLYVVSKETGISYPTLSKFFNAKPHNFTLTTMVTMTNYIRKGYKPVVADIEDGL